MLIFIFLISALLIGIIVILAIGLDSRIAINLDNGFAVADTFILKGIFLFKFKVILHDEDFYIKIGNKPYRKLKFYINNMKPKRKSSMALPKITISKMDVKVCAGVENAAFLDTVMWGGLELLLDNLQLLISNYVNIKHYRNIISPSYTDNSAKLAVDINIKFSILKLLSFLTFKSNIAETLENDKTIKES